MTYDVVIAGAGLAGASAALALSREHSVAVLDAEGPAAGASGASAGIVNPFMGRKAKPVWRRTEALDALDALLDDAQASAFLHRSGVLRPAAEARQAEAFTARAVEYPTALAWLSPPACAERWPDVAAPHGALFVCRGGHVEIPALVRAVLRAAETRGAVRNDGWRLQSWRVGGEGLIAITDHGDLGCRHLLLALGDGARAIPALDALPLHRVKGQTLRLARPTALPADLPAIAGRGYVVPSSASVIVGATFEHGFTSTAPDPARDAELQARAAHLVPTLADAEVLDRQAGVRITVPATVSPGRLPLVGPLPGHPGVWVFTGLGAKGLLTAPLLAPELADALTTGRLPPEVDTRSVLGRA